MAHFTCRTMSEGGSTGLFIRAAQREEQRLGPVPVPRLPPAWLPLLSPNHPRVRIRMQALLFLKALRRIWCASETKFITDRWAARLALDAMARTPPGRRLGPTLRARN